MSEYVTLTARGPIDAPLEMDGIVPDRLLTLREAEIGALPVWHGSRRVPLGEFFTVRGELSPQVRVEGDLTRVHGLGERMSAGELIVHGDVGHRVAAGLSGGAVTVHGSVGDDAGVAMRGGTLRIAGRAGDRVGGAEPGASRGMTGGEIVVGGDVGREAGARLRRGLIVVAGDAGDYGARGMIAGTLVVRGRTGRGAGRGSKRGSVVALGAIEVPATYRYACTYSPPHVRLTLVYLRRRYALELDERLLDGRYRRYCGDAGDPGKGEILAFEA